MKVFALTIKIERDYEDIIDAIIDTNIMDMSILGFNIEFKSEYEKLSFVNIYSGTEEEAIKNANIIKSAIENIEDIGLEYTYKIEELDSDYYLYLYKDFLKPFSIERLTIIPTEKDESTENIKEPKIYISKQYAFGTGTHDTTSLALKMLYNFLDNTTTAISLVSFADIGSGSGILSLAAYSLGVRNITAVDNDKEAVSCTKENFIYNNFDIPNLYIGSANTLAEKKQQYNIVVANIETDILVDIIEYLENIVISKGHLILSGILIEKKESMYESIEKHSSLKIEKELSSGEWMSILLKKC